MVANSSFRPFLYKHGAFGQREEGWRNSGLMLDGLSLPLSGINVEQTVDRFSASYLIMTII